MPWRTNASLDPGRSIWICPSNPRRSNGKNLFHYCLNEEHDGTGTKDQQTRLSSIRHPTTVVCFSTRRIFPPPVTGVLSTQTFTARAHSLRS